jgi:hypothetical protein
MTTQQPIASGRFAPLAALLAQLRFTHERADYLEDTQWTVYAHPRVSDKEGHFDALIHITPRSAETGTAQGIRLVAERGNTIWLPAGRTNRRGQVWFPELPFGDFSARLADVKVKPDKPEPVQKRAMHGAPAQAQRPEASRATPWNYYLDDRRVIAILAQRRDGRAELTVGTEAPELAGAVVRFSLGEETGTIILSAHGSSGFWRGTEPLQQTFDAAQASVPSFVIEPSPAHKEEKGDDL